MENTLKVDKEALVEKTWRALAVSNVANEEYLSAYGAFINAEETLKTKRAEATLQAEGKTASIRTAWATLSLAKELVDRAKAKIDLEAADITRDTERLYYRVISSVLAASGGSPIIYPINDTIPDPLKEIERAYSKLKEADKDLIASFENYILKDTELTLKKSQKIANGLPGKNEDERMANLNTDPEIIAAREEAKDARIRYENAHVLRGIERDNLKFWLSYVRSLGLDESGVDDPGRIVRR